MTKFKKQTAKKSASSTKLVNKNNNKLAKKGKLKKKKRTLKVDPDVTVEKNAESDMEVQEEELPLQPEDFEYFGSVNRDLKFLTDIDYEDSTGKPKKAKSKQSIEEIFESSNKVSNFQKKEIRNLLPLKNKVGLIPCQEEIVEENEENIDSDLDSTPQKKSESTKRSKLPKLTFVQLTELRQKRLSSYKERIALLAHGIIENPQENIGKMKDLRLMFDIDESDIHISVIKCVMITLLEIFKDIIPSYRIRIATEKEKQQVVKKETFKLRGFEEGLINNYKHFLQFLECIIKCKPPKSQNKKAGKDHRLQIPEETLSNLQQIGIKCLCELLSYHPHFNFRSNIITLLMPYANSKKKHLSEMILTHFERLFKSDHDGDITLEIVKVAGQMIKAAKSKVIPDVLYIFLSLPINKISVPKANEKNPYKVLSRKEKKGRKMMKNLDKELEEAAVLDDKSRRLKLHTDIMNILFVIYFRIIKNENCKLLSPVLEGLAKFAHLIDLDFFVDLFAVFNNLISSGNLTIEQSLLCIQTAFKILSDQGASLNIDPLNYYTHLYNMLLLLYPMDQNRFIPLLLDNINLMICKRKKHVSFNRVSAFMKRMSLLSLLLKSDGNLAILACMRSILSLFSKCDTLLDPESETCGIYSPEIEDADHCNANYAVLWELILHKTSYHPTVKALANHILNGCPSTVQGQLSAEFLHTPPSEIFAMFSIEEMQFNPPLKKKMMKAKCKFNSTMNIDELKNIELKNNSVENIDFYLSLKISNNDLNQDNVIDISSLIT